MRKQLLVAGIAALACAGAVFAAERDVHVLKVALPDGSVEQIRYTGDVAPKVIVAPAAPAMAEDDMFADVDRLFAAMDAQADAMMRQAATLAAQPPAGNAQMTRTSDGGSGTSGGGGSSYYSFVSTTGGAEGGCLQSYEMTSYGGKDAPKVVSHQSGDCKGVPALVPTAAPEPPKPGIAPTAAKPQAPTVKVTKDAHVI